LAGKAEKNSFPQPPGGKNWGTQKSRGTGKRAVLQQNGPGLAAKAACLITKKASLQTKIASWQTKTALLQTKILVFVRKVKKLYGGEVKRYAAIYQQGGGRLAGHQRKAGTAA
jgi:hypothetical protein